eukprot:622550_1
MIRRTWDCIIIPQIQRLLRIGVKILIYILTIIDGFCRLTHALWSYLKDQLFRFMSYYLGDSLINSLQLKQRLFRLGNQPESTNRSGEVTSRKSSRRKSSKKHRASNLEKRRFREKSRNDPRSPKRLRKPVVVQKKILVLDLDETLIHTTPVEPSNYGGSICDYHEIEILENQNSKICFVVKRPDLQFFLKKMSLLYELVIFTASLRRYADPVIDLIDPERTISQRFFRESCRAENGGFVKDLGLITGDLSSVAIIDNSPVAYSLQPDNAIPIAGWYDDPFDDELVSLIPFLTALSVVDDVRSILRLRLHDRVPHETPLLGCRLGTG